MSPAARWTGLLLSVCGYLLVAGQGVAWETPAVPAVALVAAVVAACVARGGRSAQPTERLRGWWAASGSWQRAEIAAWLGLGALFLVSIVRGDPPEAARAAGEWAAMIGLGCAVALVGRDTGRVAAARGAAIAIIVLTAWWSAYIAAGWGGGAPPSGRAIGMIGRRALAALLLVGLLPGRMGRAFEVLSAVTLGASTNRGALVGAVATLPVGWRRLPRAGLVLLALFAAAAMLFAPPLRWRRSRVLADDAVVVSSGRILVWRYTAAAAREAPWWGHGVGRGNAAFDRARIAAVTRGGPDTAPALPAHNLVLQTWLDAGAAAAVLILVAWALSLRRLVAAGDRWGVSALSAWFLVGASESVAQELPMELLLTLALVPARSRPELGVIPAADGNSGRPEPMGGLAPRVRRAIRAGREGSTPHRTGTVRAPTAATRTKR